MSASFPVYTKFFRLEFIKSSALQGAALGGVQAAQAVFVSGQTDKRNAQNRLGSISV
jgi:hypothetical protein